MRHLMSPLDLSVEELDKLLTLANDIEKNPKKYAHACDGKKLATLFYEPSTRTRLSFETAMLNLGGSVIGFSYHSSYFLLRRYLCDASSKRGSSSRCFLKIQYSSHQCRRRRSSTSHPDTCGSAYHPLFKGQIIQFKDRSVRRFKIRPYRTLLNQCADPLSERGIRTDLPEGTARTGIHKGRRPGCEQHPIH